MAHCPPRPRAGLRPCARPGGFPAPPPHHRRKGAAQGRPPLEGGVDDPALALPLRAIGQEHRTGPAAGAAPRPRGQDLGKSIGAGLEHLVDQAVDSRGRSGEETACETPPSMRVEPCRLGREDVLPKHPHVAPERHAIGPRGRFGGQRRALGSCGDAGCACSRASRSGLFGGCAVRKARSPGVSGPAVDAEIIVIRRGPPPGQVVEGVEILEMQLRRVSSAAQPASRA